MTMPLFTVLTALLSALSLTACLPRIEAQEPMAADVVVYGSTPGGVSAAIAAAREGASVILLEPTRHVGGLNTGGLSFSDSNQTVRNTVMGLFDEWHARIEADYASRGITLPYQVRVKDQSRWTYEPHVAARVTAQMLEDAGVPVLTECWLRSVNKDGTRITALETTNGTFRGTVFVDASYEGDLMAAAGVSWTIGREGRAAFGESLAGKQYPKRRMEINGFDAEGRLLPLVTTTDAGPEESGDSHVMTYSFRLCLTDVPENRVSMPKPANYDPVRFEIMRRHVRTGGTVGFDLYPLPGGKFDGNNSIGGQFSLGLVGGGDDWCEADETGRAAILQAHREYTLEFYHFLTTDPAVPQTTREKFARLGLCKDEFADSNHFSPALYVREGRRMQGKYVLRQQDILDDPKKHDPIIVSSFPIDSHDCQRVALNDGGVVNEGTIFPVRRKKLRQGYAYHVPYRSILPMERECTNLLVPVALSCTHVALSSIRVEPTWMILGQSAGIAAALSVSEDTTVQDLPYPNLRARLLAQKQVLELPVIPPQDSSAASIAPDSLPGIVLDDERARLTGEWSHSVNFTPHVGRGYIYTGQKGDRTQGDGSSTATFRFQTPTSGEYQLLMAWSAHRTRASNVPVTISSGRHSSKMIVDQTRPLPAGRSFQRLGTVQIDAGVETVIEISNKGTAGFVIVDALQLIPTDDDDR